MPAENLSFNDFVQAERKKKKDQAKNEELWNEIRGRKKNAPGAGSISNSRKNLPQVPSLASRMGVTKRSSSAKPNINGKWGHDLHALNNPRAARVGNLQRTASASRIERGNKNINPEVSRNTIQVPTGPGNNGTGNGGINIRGMGTPGPFTVVASNFAPGTTAADIEAVMAPIGGEMVGCRLASSHPTVIAEMQFVEKEGADQVIATFNNKKADGRLLYVYFKNPTPTGPRFSQAHSRPTAPAASFSRDREEDTMDIDDGEREISRHAQPSVQDGRYGFNESGGSVRGRDNRRGRGRGRGGGLASDSMMRDRSFRSR